MSNYTDVTAKHSNDIGLLENSFSLFVFQFHVERNSTVVRVKM
jgi:hypothetical protein